MTHQPDALDLALIEATPQRSADWHHHRLGKFTASELWKLMGKPGNDTEDKYIYEKIAERLTGLPARSVDTAATQWGNEWEPVARQEYTAVTGQLIVPSGFVQYSEYAGGSPDGVVLHDGIIEIKCPYNTAVHLQHRAIDCAAAMKADWKEHYWQIQANLLFTRREYCHFISFDPRIQPPLSKLFTIRIEAEQEDQERIKEKLDEATATMKTIMGRMGL